jgi:preprotein translocase subunit SecB
MSRTVEPSPLQLKQILFTKLSVEVAQDTEMVAKYWAPEFDFSNTPITTRLELAVRDDQEVAPTDFKLVLRLTMGVSDETRGKVPYVIDICAHAYFQLDPAFPAENRQTLVRINGASMMLGAIREQVLMMTSRSVFGPLSLPSLRFLAD